MYEIHDVGMGMYALDGTRKGKRQRYKVLKKELDRLESFPTKIQ
jgi:hypothetical protein